MRRRAKGQAEGAQGQDDRRKGTGGRKEEGNRLAHRGQQNVMAGGGEGRFGEGLERGWRGLGERTDCLHVAKVVIFIVFR